MRKSLIAGNWKMNKTPYQAQMLARQIDSIQLDDAVEALICVPAIDLQAVNEVLDDSQLHLGAQNMYYEDHGAFTGEISASMLKDLHFDVIRHRQATVLQDRLDAVGKIRQLLVTLILRDIHDVHMVNQHHGARTFATHEAPHHFAMKAILRAKPCAPVIRSLAEIRTLFKKVLIER